LLRASSWFPAWLTVRPWRWRSLCPYKTSLTFTGLQGVISPKTELLTVNAVRISNRTRNALVCYQGSKQHISTERSTSWKLRISQADNLHHFPRPKKL
jgi:hypothetical protein